MRIKINPLDVKFSKMIRTLRPFCEVCHKNKSTQVHHWKGRRYQSVRYDPDNAWSVCFSCHRKFEEDPHWAMSMQKKRLGKRFEAFVIKANMTMPSYMIDKKLLEIWMKCQLKESKNMLDPIQESK